MTQSIFFSFDSESSPDKVILGYELFCQCFCAKYTVIGVMFMGMSQQCVGWRFQNVGSVQEDMGQKNV